MHEHPVDLDTLLQRLRAAAAEHSDAALAAPVRARPWALPSASDATEHALPWGLVARAGGLAPYLLVDDAAFATLAYQRLLGRAPDDGGAAYLLERLRQHVPRTELLAGLVLSNEARQLHPQGAAVQRALALALLGGLRVARGLRSEWVARGVLRRTERWLTRRAQRSALGLAWYLGNRHDAAVHALQCQVAALQAQLQAQSECADDRHDAQQHINHTTQAALARQALEQAGAGGAGSAAVDDFLAALEVSFRGPVDDLQAQLAQDYLPQLQALRTQLGDGPCLDLGCGRGVWLALLQAHGFAARGIDLNAAAVAQAQAQGLAAELGDALGWLRAQPEGSALAITAFHLMEHLPFALRLALVTECARVLRPGGLLILETPNPENIWVATHTFHHDPTHSQPLTPDSLAFLVNYCGLQTLAVPRLHPYPPEAGLPGDDPTTQRLNHMTCGGQDFAVLAHKPL
ncbi:methyltransferase domain-containing protein [Simplicispira metamorpha]|uniref:O-antigen chain-terminating methyltransferase n=1 Tax=Simplicispira metamorpha TaxID=80881 RepID=A0A4R2NFE7_9BURK|nr:methyltransferase domain-containing protein [Simplicispira metamorpha]TCP19835.1 O-antigen chain-terminating methyltransferase [Simplicispira metamorpha]